jgi:hypothetical protein
MADQARTDGTIAELGAHAVIEAFIDGEAVDPRALRNALADAGARDHLVDLLLIRGAVGVLNNPLQAAARGAPASVSGPRARAKWLTAAAATVLVSLSVGYVAGQRLVAPAAPSAVEVVLPPTQADPAAPAPTRSIAFTPGVNWTESSGGR